MKILVYMVLIVFAACSLAIVATRTGSESLKTIAGIFLMPGGVITSVLLPSGPAGGVYFIGLVFLSNVFLYGLLSYLIVALVRRFREAK